MKKLLILLSILLIAPLAFADTPYDEALILAVPQGRMNAVSDSTIISIWYEGNNECLVGVSESTSDIYLWESNAAATTIPQIRSTGFIDVSETSANTVGQVVDLINFDSNGDWKAIVGPDATRGTAIQIGYLNRLSVRAPGVDEQNATEITYESSQARGIMTGVKSKEGAYARINSINVSGYSTSVDRGILQVWDDNEQLYELSIPMASSQREVSPTTVEFPAPGLGAGKGEGIVAVMHPLLGIGLNSSTSYDATGNVSIIYNVFQTQ